MARIAKLAGVTRPKGKRGRPSRAELALRTQMAQPVSNETDAERVERISERFIVMYRLAQGLIAGNIRSLIVSGAPGTGKSYTIRRLLEQAHDTKNTRYDLISGGTVSPIGLYRALYNYRNEGDIILLDDCDAVYEDEIALNLLKAALDTGEDRRISWRSESRVLKEESIEDSFLYNGSIGFITNKDIRSAMTIEGRKMSPHYQALVDRSVYLDLKLHAKEDVLAWVCHMTLKHHMLKQMELTTDQELSIVNWVKKHYKDIPALSLRTMRTIAGFMLTDENTWESFAKVTILG